MAIQAYVLHGAEDLRLEQRQERPLGAGDVLVDVRRAGICGSDVHYYRHYRIGDFVPRNPLVLGHEFAGEVVEVGPEVRTVNPGDRVTAEPSIECGHCRYCRAGRYNLCTNLKFIGTAATVPHIDGAFSERLVVPESHCYVLPENIGFAAGALAEPMAVGANAVMRAGVLAGSRVLITGGGTIGQMVLAVARVVGAADLTVADIAQNARQFSLEHGARAAFDPADQKAVDEHTGEGFDVVFETSGAPPALALALRAAARGARVVQVGTQPAEVSLPANLIMSKELTVLGSLRYAHVYPMVLEMMASGKVDVESLVSVVYPFAQMQKAMERAVAGSGSIVKVQISRDS